MNAYCSAHYMQLHEGQELRSIQLVAPSGGHVNRNGYRIVYVSGQPILEHRLVMEHLIGRPLEPHENVHHINGDKVDNRPDNLELWANKQPRGQRVEDLITFVLDHYRPQLMRRLEQDRQP